mgnify:CR=1 FL=1
MKLKTSISILAGCLLIFLFIMLPVFLSMQDKKEQTIASFKGSDFSLKDMNNNTITQESFNGPLTAIFFGFTHCPDVCPMSLTHLKVGMLNLNEQAKDVQVLFISIDPERDTPEKLKAFAEANGSNEANWHFLTGPKATLMKLAVEDLKLISMPKEKLKRENPGDLFVHSSLYILVDSKGQVRASFEHDATNLVQMIQKALETLEKDL